MAACGPINPPVQPPSGGPWDFSVSVEDAAGVRIPAAMVTANGIQKAANDFGWAYFLFSTGCYQVRVEAPHYRPYAPESCQSVDRHVRLGVVLQPDAPPTPRLVPNGQLFTQDGQPWRWKGITAFGLQNLYCKGENIEPFLTAAKGFNVLRVFLYVEWEGTGWPQASDECIDRFLTHVGERGFYVEETLLTGAKPHDDAQALITHFFTTFASHTNLMVELVNEPHLYGKPDTVQLAVPLDTPLLWTSGDYDPASSMHGRYGVAHTPRDNEWPRKAHDLLEYFHGGGPGTPADPPHPFPIVADEPIRPDQAGYVVGDFEGYFGAAALLGAGATFHFESGKYGQPPTPQEADCAVAALRALDFYPLDAALGSYYHNIPDEQATGSLRPYTVGPYTVRVRPTSKAPQLQPY